MNGMNAHGIATPDSMTARGLCIKSSNSLFTRLSTAVSLRLPKAGVIPA